MHTELVAFKSSLIHYSLWGSGPEVWIGIPGYGAFSDCFNFLTGHLASEEVTLVVIDLPFHGRTLWKDSLRFEVHDLIGIIEQILGLVNRKAANFKLFGFSMGARVALSLTEKIPERIIKLVLIAPDGLHSNAWYFLATQNSWGKRLFHVTIKHPAWIFLLLRMGKFCRIIDPELFNFANHFIQDNSSREDLYNRWTVLKTFNPNLSFIKSGIYKYKIPVELLFGKDDPMAKEKYGEMFRSGIESFCRIHLIEGTHQLLKEQNASIILSLIKK